MPASHTALYSHVIFSTKNRANHITPDLRDRLYQYIGGIIRQADGDLIAAGGAADHVHLLIRLHPRIALADLLRLVKANSSKWIHETFAAMGDFGWQDGYAAFSVSQSNVADVQRYIAQQEEHHRQVSFREELVAFFQRHGITYDERYI